MSGIWSGLVGQADAIATMRQASDSARTGEGSIGAMTHSWLITGPPGSGRSNLAYAFATALLSDGTAEGDARTRAMVAARTHPDLAVLSTERVIISIEEVRGLLSSSQYSPSVARYRVMVIEDADRMTERTSNLLLKALEEPPPRTVWILCAPSEADLLPTIRSRVRIVRLRTPEAADVAKLLVERRRRRPRARPRRRPRGAEPHRHGASARNRCRCPRPSRRDPRRRARPRQRLCGGNAAARLLAIAGDDAKAITEQKDAEERASALRSLGVEPGGTVPPALRSQLKALEEDQKRRATRSLRDGIDRILVDLLSLYRDILLEQLHAGLEPVNVTARDAIARAAASERRDSYARDHGCHRHRASPDRGQRAARARPRGDARRRPIGARVRRASSTGRTAIVRTALRAAASTAVAALTLGLLSACFLAPNPRPTSTPYPEEVAAGLEPYYQQTLVWSDCGDGMQCTTATAPLDWDAPDAADDIELALVRHLASGTRRDPCSSTRGARALGLRLRARQPRLRRRCGPRRRLRRDRMGSARGRQIVRGRVPATAADLDQYLFGDSDAPVDIAGVHRRGRRGRRPSSSTRARRRRAGCSSSSTPSAPCMTSTCCARSSATPAQLPRLLLRLRHRSAVRRPLP